MRIRKFNMWRGRVGIFLVCGVLGHSSSVLGQEPPAEGPQQPIGSRRPFRVLFGDARAEPELSRGVDFTGSVFEVYDQNLLADVGSLTSSAALNPSGAYTNLVGDLRFVRRGSRLQMAGTGGANARYYSGLGEFVASDYHAGFGVSARTSPLTTVEASQTLSYSPVSLLGLFVNAQTPLLGDARPPVTDFAVTDDRSVTAATGVEVERGLSDRALVSFTGGFRRSHYLVENQNGTDFSTVDGGGLYRYRVTEEGDLEFGYTYRRARYTGGQASTRRLQPDEHLARVGLAFHPTLSEARRTVLTFQGGTSLVRAPFATSALEMGWQLRLVGDASVLHQLGRTWQVVGSFERGTAFVEGLNAPVFTDAISVSTNGFVNSRTDLLASLAYSNGEPSLVGAATTFSTTTANARVRVALSSRWAFTSEYLFYFYDFSTITQLAPGLSPRVKRNSVRAGLALWLPLHRP
jgi:hypothetical protein